MSPRARSSALMLVSGVGNCSGITPLGSAIVLRNGSRTWPSPRYRYERTAAFQR
ncbi:hypothetical protein [Brevundimonas sp. R86498]|uniref:hypothetical protein n=1 Tax=Brevundimonas sp. R86498 TaxID=3093845 RepID=UPI0037CC0CF6